MILQRAIRWMMALAFFAGTSAAQQAPPAQNTQQEAQPAKAGQQAETSDPGQEKAAFKSWREMLSYAFGANLAGNLRRQKIDVDADMMVKALKDGLAGNKLLMSATDVQATLKRFEEEQKQDFEHAKSMRSERNKREGDARFAENMKEDGVVTLPSGLQYKVLRKGEGSKPALDDSVVCNYRGRLLDGTEFDSSYRKNEPVTLPVKGLIKGLTEGLQLMPVGSRWELFVPPQLAYGDRIVGGIGPNAMLVFEVELLSIKDHDKGQAANSPALAKK